MGSEQTGRVKTFNPSKGTGLITPDDGGMDIYVQIQGLIDQIRDGDSVSYVVVEGKKGPEAQEVKLV